MNGNSGYSLIELVLVMVIIAILAPLIATPLAHNFSGWVDVVNRKDINDDARSAVDRMVRELRHIRNNPGDIPSITLADSDSITFENMESDDITFAWDGAGNDLEMDGVPLVSADVISAFSISYFDEDNTPLTTFPLSAADTAAIRQIRLNLGLVKGSDTLTIQNQVHLRNFQ